MSRPDLISSRRQFLQRTAGGLVVLGAARPSLAWQDSPRQPLLVHSETPMNAEPLLEQLVLQWVTPIKSFYIRSHAPVPQIDAAAFRLSVEGLVDRPLKLTLAELKRRFGSNEVFATLTCAGNRRSEHSRVKEVSGVQWKSGAIGNAKWTGPRLSDVLRMAGIKEGAKHVWFEGVDEIKRDGGVIPFGASIPLDKAMADKPQMPGTLLAYKMNDLPLPPDHGFPLRTVVPGYIGARSVKWLGRIVVSDRPSDNHYVAGAYKLVDEGTEEQWSAASPLGEYLMNSVTCVPSAGDSVKPGVVEVRGYALPPGISGRSIRKIEVSADGGQRWTTAASTSPERPFCWQLWSARVAVTAATKSLIVRATDSSGAVQPAKVDWNLKGYMFNAWHQTPLRVEA